MSVCGLLPKEKAQVSGSITVDGNEIFRCSDRQILSLLGDKVGVVFQEPMTAMNPVMKIGPQIEEALRCHTRLTKKERKAKALEAMALAELPEPETLYHKYPHMLSGGMLQRAMIAAAIITKPQLLLADEPTTALDVTVQQEILALLKELAQKQNMAVLLISHDLHVVKKLCSRVAVMQRGKIVEDRPVEALFSHPEHPYTPTLLAAIPKIP